MNQLRNVFKIVGAAHSLVHLVRCVLAVAALAAIGLAEHTHLEALTVLLLAVRFLALAPVDVPRRGCSAP